MIQDIETNLACNLIEYPSSKALWDGLATTYGAGRDAFEVYALHNQAIRQVQGDDTLEQYWDRLQRLWLAIDQRRPNPMKDAGDISEFNRMSETIIAIKVKGNVIKTLINQGVT